MADYISLSRTNYFRVTDEAAYRAFYSCLRTENEALCDFTTEKDGTIWHGFGMYGTIDDNDSEDEIEDWLHKLQKLLPKDEAMILLEIGHEKLRYLVGEYTVVTSKVIEYGNIEDAAINTARRLLHDPSLTTKIEY